MFGHAVKASPDAGIRVTGPRLDGDDAKSLEQPFAVFGRSDDASIVLPDRTVSLRHVYLQQINGRLFVCDLFSANGTRLGSRKIQSGWWPADATLSLGPYDLSHGVDAGGDVPPSPMDFRPRSETDPFYEPMPEVSLELLDKKTERGQAWPINRVVTLLGRDDRCRISCGHDSVSLVHCALVLTPAGLWVIDLLSRNGVHVNGNAVSCALLSDGFEMQVGRYKMRAHVVEAKQSSPSIPVGGAAPNVGFLTKNHRIFTVETTDNVIVVTPRGDLQDFMYQDVQSEANAVIHCVTAGGYDHVVIDFSAVRLVGSIIIEAIAGFCRAAPKKAALCCASVDMYSTLENMKLPSIWYHYASRDDAIAAVRFDD